MPIIVEKSTTTKARIGYVNLFAMGAVIASSETPGYEAANAYDGRLYDWWRPASGGVNWIQVSLSRDQEADYVAVWGHDLHEVGAEHGDVAGAEAILG